MQRTGTNRSVRWGAVLISVGAIIWLVQGSLLIVALPAVAGSFNLSPSSPANNSTVAVHPVNHTHAWIAESAVNTSLGTFELATLCAVLASLLIAAGAILLLRRPPRGGDPNRTARSEGSSALSRETRALGIAAAVFVVAFASCGILTIMALQPQLGNPVGTSCGSWGDGCPITTAIELWLAGSVFLLVGAEIFAVFSERLAEQTGGRVRIHGALFSNYAIVNFVGLAVVPFAAVLGAGNGNLADSLLYAALFAQLFVVPITGYVAWSWLTVHGLQSALRKGNAAGESEGSGFVHPDEEVAVSAGFRSPTVGNQWPSEARATGDRPFGAGTSTATLDPDWAFRLQARIQNLERIVVAQNETIVDLRNLLTRLPADPSEVTVRSRVGSVDQLGKNAETVHIRSPPSPRVPEEGLGPRPPRLASADRSLESSESTTPNDGLS
jgi:hypothetical protein